MRAAFRFLPFVFVGLHVCTAQLVLRQYPYVCPALPQEKIGDSLPPAVAASVGLLYSPDTPVQGGALHELAKLGKEAVPAVPYILDMGEGLRRTSGLDGKTAPIGMVADQVLARIAQDAPEAFLTALEDPASPRAVHAIRAVAGSPHPEVGKRLLKLSSAAEEPVRKEAARALVLLYGLQGHEDATKRVDELVRKDPSPLVRGEILRTVSSRGPMEPGDPREALLISVLRDDRGHAEALVFDNYQGTPSPELFQAVLDTLDRNLCSRSSKHLFLRNTVKLMKPLLTKQLDDKDETVRQRAYLLLYHYLPDVADEYVEHLLADPSPAVQGGVIRHIMADRALVGELGPDEGFFHAGYCYRLAADKRGVLWPHWDRQNPRPGRWRIGRRIMDGANADHINMVLAAERETRKVDATLLHRAFAEPATRTNAMRCLPAAEFTVDEMLLALELDGEEARKAALEKLRDCTHDDPRLLTNAILLAGKEPSLAAQALWAGIRHREKHAGPLLREVFNTGGPELRQAACEVVVSVLPREEAREILLKRQTDPDPKVRETVEQLLRRVPPAGQGAVWTKPPEPGELRMAFDQYAWGHEERRRMPREANPAVAGLPDDPVALALVYWAHWRIMDTKRDRERRMPDEVAKKLLPLLEEADPAVSDMVAVLLVLGRHAPAAHEVVSYLAYHSPRYLPLELAVRLGVAAAEPLTALAMHHPEQELRSEARLALLKLIEESRRHDRTAPLVPCLQQCLVLLMLEGEYVEERIWAIRSSHDLLPDHVRLAVCRKLREMDQEALRESVSAGLADRRTPAVVADGPQVEEVLAWAESPVPASRQAAALRAAVLWDDRVRKAMFDLLPDPDSRVAKAASASLARRVCLDKAVARRLQGMLAGDSREEHLRALRVMAECGDSASRMPPELPPAMRALAGSNDTQVRLALVEALQPRRSAEDRELLQSLLADSNRAVAELAHAKLTSR